jgi:hypothetical protein
LRNTDVKDTSTYRESAIQEAPLHNQPDKKTNKQKKDYYSLIKE